MSEYNIDLTMNEPALERAVKQARERNIIIPTYAEMAAHYDTAVLPARPYKPKDKSKVEVAVQVVERWILARLRHHTFFSLAELNAAIKALLPALNERPFQGRTESRRDLFDTIDRPALKPLPRNAYEYAEWRKAKPGIDYVDFGPADLSFDLETKGHPLLRTVEDCRAFVIRELEGSGVRVM